MIIWNQILQIRPYKTNKSDWTLDKIRTEKISRFLQQHGPHFEFDAKSFIYSVPKEESSGVIGGKIYIIN